MDGLRPIDLAAWIEAHRDALRPPIGNARVFPEAGFIVMVVGGPNARTDFHVDPGPELFFQVEGDIVLAVHEDGAIRDIPIRQGELFLLPPRVPHSPRRPANTVGLVVERLRTDGEEDALQWYCESCTTLVHHQDFVLDDITTQLQTIIGRYAGDESLRRCPQCGHVNAAPG